MVRSADVVSRINLRHTCPNIVLSSCPSNNALLFGELDKKLFLEIIENITLEVDIIHK